MGNHRHCHCEEGNCHSHEHEEDSPGEYIRIIVSAVLLGGGLLLSHCGVGLFSKPWLRLAWYLVAYLPVGLPVLKEAVGSFREKDYFSEFTLMGIATLGAFAIGEYPEAVAVMLFYCVGELLQDKAVEKAKGDISALLKAKPQEAEVVKGDRTVCVAPQEVQVGDIVRVKPGERVPLDGTLLTARAAFNTAALTGESLPREIREGGEVLAGMIPDGAAVEVKVSRPFHLSALSRIIHMVQDASERKAPAELFIRRFARVYTPVVIGLAVLILVAPWGYAAINASFQYVFSQWLYRSLIFLVISCPCALVVSVPLSYFGGIGAASRRGILFKGGNYLNAITDIDTVVFDKTGTLTKGDFEVRRCVAYNSLPETELLSRIASVEKGSTHPIAKAVVRYAERRKVSLCSVENLSEVTGLGLTAECASERLVVGSVRMLKQCGVDYPKELEGETDTIVACASNGVLIGFVTLSDVLKPDSRLAIDRLKRLRMKDIEMLSGDKQSIVERLASELNLDHAYGDLLPDGKVAHLEALLKDGKRRIAFVGDGMNDAPVLALSHVGIAMGGLGSDVAIETADVVIQTDQPSKVAEAIEIGRRTKRIVWQNVCLAFGIKLLVLLLGVLGVATLWEAVFADVGVTLLAVLNAMRLQLQKNVAGE